MCSTSTIGQRVNEVSMRSSEAERGGGATTYKAGGSTQLLPTHTTIADREKRSKIFSVAINLIYRTKVKTLSRSNNLTFASFSFLLSLRAYVISYNSAVLYFKKQCSVI
jgi:hypothetical protein